MYQCIATQVVNCEVGPSLAWNQKFESVLFKPEGFRRDVTCREVSTKEHVVPHCDCHLLWTAKRERFQLAGYRAHSSFWYLRTM